MNFKPKVLLVDDEPNILTAIEFLLEREGCSIAKAYNGLEALEIADKLVPDLIVLDVMMPGMDGFEVARHLRLNKKLEDSKIIFLTAKGAEQDRRNGYANGGEYYLIKPFDNDLFVSTIHEIMAYG